MTPHAAERLHGKEHEVGRAHPLDGEEQWFDADDEDAEARGRGDTLDQVRHPDPDHRGQSADASPASVLAIETAVSGPGISVNTTANPRKTTYPAQSMRVRIRPRGRRSVIWQP